MKQDVRIAAVFVSVGARESPRKQSRANASPVLPHEERKVHPPAGWIISVANRGAKRCEVNLVRFTFCSTVLCVFELENMRGPLVRRISSCTVNCKISNQVDEELQTSVT